MNVHFKQGTLEKYNSLVKDKNTFYMINDTGDLYFGEKKLTGGGTGSFIYVKTTDEWKQMIGYRPQKGEICIYSDYKYDEEAASFIPGIKIGDGNGYVSDLPFTISYLEKLLTEHINNKDIHITKQERTTWNEKLAYNMNDLEETLIFTTN